MEPDLYAIAHMALLPDDLASTLYLDDLDFWTAHALLVCSLNGWLNDND